MINSDHFDRSFAIDGTVLGDNNEPYIIAELSGNHKGNLEQALKLIDEAAACGVTAIKIQTYTADTITLNHSGAEFCLEGGLWKGRTLYDLYEEAHTPWEWHPALFKRAKENQITLFSSPFDNSAVDLLESLNCPAYKIASFEINDIGLIKYATSTNKPIIMSTGLATLDEIEEAVQAVADAGGTKLALLHCISGYPTPIEDCNLATIADLKKRFSFPVGLSDHTLDTVASVTSVSLGASVIEKHFTLDRSDGSVDAAFSLQPEEFKQLVIDARRAKLAIGNAGYQIKPSEEGGRAFRRSLYCCKDIKKGDSFSYENVRSVRPGLGLHTRYLPAMIGQHASCDIAYGTAIDKCHVANFNDVILNTERKPT